MSDLLSNHNIPITIRWYAKKCAEQNITFSSYAGWDIFTKPVNLDKYTSTNHRIFSTTDIYLTESFDITRFHTVASETRIYVTNLYLAMGGDIQMIELIAPYISLSGISYVEAGNIFAETYVSQSFFYSLPAPETDKEVEFIYISSLPIELMVPPCIQYEGPKFALNHGDVFTKNLGGFNPWHAIALGVYPPAEAQKLCSRTDMQYTQRMDMTECLLKPPSPQAYTYPDDIVQLSPYDYARMLMYKNTYEICKTIHRPFLYYYPDIEYSDKPHLADMVETTTSIIRELKNAGHPNCEGV